MKYIYLSVNPYTIRPCPNLLQLVNDIILILLIYINFITTTIALVNIHLRLIPINYIFYHSMSVYVFMCEYLPTYISYDNTQIVSFSYVILRRIF